MVINTLRDLADQALYLYKIEVPLKGLKGFKPDDTVTVFVTGNRDSIDHPDYLKDYREYNNNHAHEE